MEFLEDTIPKTVPFKQVKEAALATRAKFQAAPGKPGEMQGPPGAAAAAGPGTGPVDGVEDERAAGLPNGKRHKASSSSASATDVAAVINGAAGPSSAAPANGFVSPGARNVLLNSGDEDPNAQLQMEMRQVQGQDGDVDMTG